MVLDLSSVDDPLPRLRVKPQEPNRHRPSRQRLGYFLVLLIPSREIDRTGLVLVELETKDLGECLHAFPRLGCLIRLTKEPDVIMQPVEKEASLAIDSNIHEEEHEFSDELLRGMSHRDAPLSNAGA